MGRHLCFRPIGLTICFASSRGQQHFYGTVTLGSRYRTRTSSSITSTDRTRLSRIWRKASNDHVAGTNMDQGATLLGQSVFDCVHRVFRPG